MPISNGMFAINNQHRIFEAKNDFLIRAKERYNWGFEEIHKASIMILIERFDSPKPIDARVLERNVPCVDERLFEPYDFELDVSLDWRVLSTAYEGEAGRWGQW